MLSEGCSANKRAVDLRVAILIKDFDRFVAEYDLNPPFTPQQLKSHLLTIRRRRELGSAVAASADPIFVQGLYDTLRSWGIGKRGSRLVSISEFTDAIAACAAKLVPFESERIDALRDSDQLATQVWSLISELNITYNQNKIVAGTKCLHHLLPDLVPPMDREYTQTFFGWHNSEFQKNSAACFRRAFQVLAHIAHAVQPERLVAGDWRTSRTKILDNAVVSFCRLHDLQSSNRTQQRANGEKFKAMVNRAKELGLWDAVESSAERTAEERLRTARPPQT